MLGCIGQDTKAKILLPLNVEKPVAKFSIGLRGCYTKPNIRFPIDERKVGSEISYQFGQAASGFLTTLYIKGRWNRFLDIPWANREDASTRSF